MKIRKKRKPDVEEEGWKKEKENKKRKQNGICIALYIWTLMDFTESTVIWLAFPNRLQYLYHQ